MLAGTMKTAPFQNRREFHGSLLTQMEEVYAFLQQYNQLGASFEGLLRRDRRDYPEEALREALLNAVVHREYSYSGSTLINIFHDRIEFVSFGGLVQGINLGDLELGISSCRKEKLAALFYRLELIEAYGTGVPKIYESYADTATKPRLEASDHAFRITLPNRNFAKDTQTVQETPAARYMTDLADAMRAKPYFTRQDVEAFLHVSRSQANNRIRELMEQGKVQAHGRGRNRFYTMNR